MLPHDGPLSLDQIASIIASSSSELGIPDTGIARSVLVEFGPSQWVNHYTVLRLGMSGEPAADTFVDTRVGAIRLVGREFSALNVVDGAALRDLLTTWKVALPQEYLNMLESTPHGPAVVQRPWDLQDSVQTQHLGGDGRFGKFPCWVLDVYSREPRDARGRNAPRGPFATLDQDFYAEDLGAAVERWTGDTDRRQSTIIENLYRIIIPDQRGYFSDVELNGRQFRVLVDGARLGRLACGLTAKPRSGQELREKRPVSNGEVVFTLPAETARVELYLFDGSRSWCDYRTEIELFSAPARRSGVLGLPALAARALSPDLAVEPTAGHPVLDLLNAPRYHSVRTHFAKALEYSSEGPSQDLPNAAKEAVCAVEALGRLVTDPRLSTLGGVIKHLKNSNRLEPTMAKSLEGLWGFVNSKPGVRHGHPKAPTITKQEAAWVVETCAAAIHFLLDLDVPP